LELFCADFYSDVIQCFATIENHLNSIFADYSGDWFIHFVGDDVVAKGISNLKKTKLDYIVKGANLGLKCVRMRLAAGLCPDPLGELECSPRPSSRNWGRGAYF